MKNPANYGILFLVVVGLFPSEASARGRRRCCLQECPVLLPFLVFDPAFNPNFYQTLTIRTRQEMKVQGMEVNQDQDQTLVIQWIPKGKNPDGNWVVGQKIVGVKMDIDIGGNKIRYDSTAKTRDSYRLADFFKALQTMGLKFHINPGKMKLEKIEGRDEFVKNFGKGNPLMKNFSDTFLSENAIQKIIEPILYPFPATAVMIGTTWQRETNLDLGGIGTYKTDYTYTYVGKEKGRDKIKIETQMNYVAPKAEQKKGLPFTIEEGEMRGQTVEAMLGKKETNITLFNRERGRFESYRTNFHLEGNLKIDIGGMKMEVGLKQVQFIRSKISDFNPWEKTRFREPIPETIEYSPCRPCRRFSFFGK